MSTILDRIHDLQYEALSEIDLVCKTNHIRFYMRGGSALGAVKYSNFVPWDDDIDIALFRDDYNKLIETCPLIIGDKFLFVCYQKVDGAHCYFPRIILKDSECKKLGFPQNNERGLLMIDILPIDGIPGSTIKKKLHLLKVYILRLLASLWSYDVNTVSMHDTRKQKIISLLYNLRIHKLYKQDSIYKMMDKMYGKYSKENSKESGILSGSKMNKEVCPTDCWGIGYPMQFRDLKVLVPRKYDDYLKKLFGDNYAIYEPPEEKRTKSHLNGTM